MLCQPLRTPYHPTYDALPPICFGPQSYFFSQHLNEQCTTCASDTSDAGHRRPHQLQHLANGKTLQKEIRLIIDCMLSASFWRSVAFFLYSEWENEGARNAFSKWEWCEAHAGLASRRRSLSSQPVRTDKHFLKMLSVQLQTFGLNE